MMDQIYYSYVVATLDILRKSLITQENNTTKLFTYLYNDNCDIRNDITNISYNMNQNLDSIIQFSNISNKIVNIEKTITYLYKNQNNIISNISQLKRSIDNLSNNIQQLNKKEEIKKEEIIEVKKEEKKEDICPKEKIKYKKIISNKRRSRK